MAEKNIPELACVDTAVGDRVLEATRPGLDSDMRQLVEAHLEVCAFCRQTVDLEQRIAGAVRGGVLRDGSSQGRGPRAGRRSLWSGVAALAAAAVAAICMFTLTPRPMGPTVSIRGAESAHFVRPVEGEVVTTKSFTASWVEVPGADSYELHLSEVDGSSSWTASTTETNWELPADLALAEDESYRLVLATVPADLLAPGAVSVRFQVGGFGNLVRHRAVRAQPVTYGLLLIGLLLGIYSIQTRRGA